MFIRGLACPAGTFEIAQAFKCFQVWDRRIFPLAREKDTRSDKPEIKGLLQLEQVELLRRGWAYCVGDRKGAIGAELIGERTGPVRDGEGQICAG